MNPFKKVIILFVISFVFMAPSWDDTKILSFTGEIVDAKCALGAMTPGTKKSHRTCAIKCIRNGVPPLLKVKVDKKNYRYYLLTAEGKHSANEMVLPYVGVIVDITGTIIKDANMVMIEIQTLKKHEEK